GRNQVALKRGDARSGLILAALNGRWFVETWHAAPGPRFDLGPVATDAWQHLAFSYDAATQTLRGYRDGLEMAVGTNLASGGTGKFRLGGQRRTRSRRFKASW